MAEREERVADGGDAPSQALADELLVAAANGLKPTELAERLTGAALNEALEAVTALGRSRAAAAGPILAAVAEGAGSGPKVLRKEARRGLHRLEAVGLKVPRPRPAMAPGLPGAERLAEVGQAWATASDGVGSRALWVQADRSLGGVYALVLVLNDVVGMKGCLVDDTTRKHAAERFERRRAESGLVWVRLPSDYAPRLIGEALELNRQTGFVIPREWLVHQRVFGNLVRPFEQALIYDEVPAAEVALRPDLLEASPTLLDEPELQAWFFGFDEVRGFALDLLQARQSQIVLSEASKAGREQRIIASAIREVVTPPIQRGLTRRLEEVAYVFLRTERARQARLAVAAARQMADAATALHPLLAAMMHKSLELASEVETAKLPVELIRHSPYDPIR